MLYLSFTSYLIIDGTNQPDRKCHHVDHTPSILVDGERPIQRGRVSDERKDVQIIEKNCE